MTKTALIAGVTGQDGAYLAHYLLSLGYRVVGTSRDAQTCNLSRLERLGVADDIELQSLALAASTRAASNGPTAGGSLNCSIGSMLTSLPTDFLQLLIQLMLIRLSQQQLPHLIRPLL